METKDYGLASLLVSQGCSLNGHRTDDMGQIWFRFDDGPEVAALEDGFYNNTCYVLIQDFISAQNFVKKVIHKNGRNAYGNGTGRFVGRTL